MICWWELKVPHQKFNENNYNTESDSEEEAPPNDEDAEANNDPPHRPTQPGESNHCQPDRPQTQSIAACEGLKLKTRQVVTYMHSESGQAHNGKIIS